MATCPNCSSIIEEDFGLVTCPSCQISLFIDMNGEAKSSEYTESKNILQGPLTGMNEELDSSGAGLSDPTKVSPPPEDFVFSKEDMNSQLVEPVQQEINYNENVLDDDDFDGTSISTKQFSISDLEDLDQNDDDFTSSTSELDPEEEELVDDLVEEGSKTHVLFQEDESFEQNYSFDEEAEGEVFDEPNDLRQSDPEGFSDVTAFGNSDESTARTGVLRYDLLITGLDSGEVRRDFFEAINDKRLLWDAEKLTKNIRNGRLKLQNISAVKAMVVVSRIRPLPIKVSWEQYAINEV